MRNNDDQSTCRSCSAPLPAASVGGICPTCLMAEAVDTINDTADATAFPQPRPGDPGTATASPPDPLEGTTLGPDGRYKILQRIGEGGFGTVFMADQTTPVKRRVAIKILKAGMDTRQVVARFEAERQALAMMDHPNIAKILDGGETDHGRPYFVMELVRGTPITVFCDEEQLSTRKRLDLFLEVCRAVQHAHQKGIIHRDLKPANILVTLEDGADPVPKVIDFGVAKALESNLTDKTLFTRFEQMIGTPAYMSPEQASSRAAHDLDTRADIYALGVLLYELLTGTTPFESQTLQQAAFDEVRRILREEDAPRPSARWSSLAQDRRTTIAKSRSAESNTVGKQLRGDLDWIVMKAIEKDRKRRYETANAFALDVEKHLEHEPVSAGPPTAAYRAGKFLRKHRVGVGIAAMLLVSLTAGLAAATAGFVRAKQEAERARMAEQEVREQKSVVEESLAASRFLNLQLKEGRDLDLDLFQEAGLADKIEPEMVAAIRSYEVGGHYPTHLLGALCETYFAQEGLDGVLQMLKDLPELAPTPSAQADLRVEFRRRRWDWSYSMIGEFKELEPRRHLYQTMREILHEDESDEYLLKMRISKSTQRFFDGTQHAMEGNWQLALLDHEFSAYLNMSAFTEHRMLSRAVLLEKLNKRSEFDAHLDAMVEQFTNSESTQALGFTAKAIAMTPLDPASPFLEAARDMAERAIALHKDREAIAPRCDLGAVEYRRADYESALTALRDAAILPKDLVTFRAAAQPFPRTIDASLPAVRVRALAFRAMSAARLGSIDRAREDLAIAADSIDQLEEPHWPFWYVNELARMAYEEAKAVVDAAANN